MNLLIAQKIVFKLDDFRMLTNYTIIQGNEANVEKSIKNSNTIDTFRGLFTKNTKKSRQEQPILGGGGLMSHRLTSLTPRVSETMAGLKINKMQFISQ